MVFSRLAAAAALALASPGAAQQLALRGSALSAAAAEAAKEPLADERRLSNATGSTVPSWCEFVPTPFQNVACGSHATRGTRGEGSCGCAGWCENTFEGSWQWDPECCGCDANHRDRDHHRGDDDRDRDRNRGDRGRDDDDDNVPDWCDDIPRSERSEVRACRGGARGRNATVPGWCEYVPVAVKANVLPCSGGECSCARECSDLQQESWLYSPMCCGCDGVEKHHERASKSKRDSKAPKWCNSVPNGALDYVPQCVGEAGCACGSYCTSIESDFWRWNPDCCGCTGGEEDDGDDRSGGDSHRDDRRHHHHHSRAEKWCSDVPVSERVNMLPCSGLGECQCSSLCDAAPQAFWRYNPLCCGCDGAEQHRHQPTGHSEHRKGDEPEWCSSIPEAERDYAPQCSSGECQCAEECDSASPLQWRFIPGCCGCQTNANRVERSRGRNTPSWCEDVLEIQLPFMPQCTGNACSCSSLCHWTPKISWDNNPACCGCHGKEDNIP